MSRVLALRLTEILEGPEQDIPLTEAALLIASHQEPNLDVPHYLREIAQYGETLSAQLDADADPVYKVAALNRFLFEELEFSPNAQDYYDVHNSLLNHVLERRTGIPITLSLVYMAIGEHIGLNFSGVCFPGHFLVKTELPNGVVVIDPFSNGLSLSISDLQARLRDAQGGEVSRAIVASLLVGASKRDILLRMLSNLKAIYWRNRDFDHALTIMDWIIAANPQQPAQLRDRGLVYEELECFRAAVSDFERYLDLDPDSEDGEAIRNRIVELGRKVSRLN